MTFSGSFRFAVNGRSVENIRGAYVFKTAALNHSAILPRNEIKRIARAGQYVNVYDQRDSQHFGRPPLLIQAASYGGSYV